MHKILIQTELPHLRELGYEVFCPAYKNPSKQHQSAANGWTPDQATTLPPEVFRILSQTNFFYSEITDKVYDLLNEYFDAVVVTIDPTWLIEIVRGYRGKVIYRTYGHVQIMSDFLNTHNATLPILNRKNFWYVPHSHECALHEHQWLRSRMSVVPYCVTSDILPIQNKWFPTRAEIMISCPNITNPFYLEHFEYLKEHFTDKQFRFFGVQSTPSTDPQVVGTISFSELLKAFTECSGFLYTYRQPTVCFLPPIEMMICGGPVIFLTGSLLDQYFPDGAPGRAQTEAEAIEKCHKLTIGSSTYDHEFVNSVIASQAEVRSRYLPEDVWPIFDKTFKNLLDPETENLGLFTSEFGFDGPKFYLDLATDDFKIISNKKDLENESLEAEIAVNLKKKVQHGNLVVFCTQKNVLKLLEIFVGWTNVTFKIIDGKKQISEIEPILYSADSKYGRLFFAIMHPQWLKLKLITLLKSTYKKLTVNFLRLNLDQRKQIDLIVELSRDGQKIFLISQEQKEKYLRNTNQRSPILEVLV